MKSPILKLEEGISAVAFNIAPEKVAECVGIRDRNEISIEFTDDKGFAIRVNLDSNTILLPICSLEYLWAFSHYCWVLTQEYAHAQRSKAHQFDCLGNSRLRDSYKIMDWAKYNLSATDTSKWPPNLPVPKMDPEHCSDIHVANELFLSALGWMVHHEIGHIVLEHSRTTTPLAEKEEKEADLYATDWILSGIETEDHLKVKRAHGIAVGVLCLQSLEIENRSCLRNTHPNANDRINYCLSRHKVGDNEVIEAFCTVVLQFLFSSKNIKANVDGDSFEKIMIDILIDISRLKNSTF